MKMSIVRKNTSSFQLLRIEAEVNATSEEQTHGYQSRHETQSLNRPWSLRLFALHPAV